MTSMRQHTGILNVPRQSDPESVEAHCALVLEHFNGVFAEIDSALRETFPTTGNIFSLLEGPIDLALHAMLVRYIVRLALQKVSGHVVEEDWPDFDVLRVANCGLCLRTEHGDIRILKCPTDGMPKAQSGARILFVTNNQLSFSFAEDNLPSLKKLNLFVLWRMDTNYQYLGIDVACPKEIRNNGDIECYWITPLATSVKTSSTDTELTAAPDLDEIVLIPTRDKKIS